MSGEMIALSAITLVAATVNGALGYGFSSLTVPTALLFLTNRVLNPALVLIEVPLNAYVLITNRRALPGVWRAMLPLLVGLPVGVLIGTRLISEVNPAWMKLWTFACLIPVILFQAAGYRRSLDWDRRFGVAFGGGLGVLYAVTTISGPPLAVLLNNQGFAKGEFRAGLGLVRFVESTLTAAFYAWAGMFTTASLDLSLLMVPSLAIGVPLGATIIRHVRSETFRRICMSLDAWVVAFGLASVLRMLRVVDTGSAVGLFAAVACVDLWLLYRYFRSRPGILVSASP
jgi:uncharacterized protein